MRAVITGVGFVAEFRNRAWQTHETLAFLRALDIGVVNVDQPLYALGRLAGVYNAYAVSIDAEQEPAYREFFTEVAQLCGRSVAQPIAP